MQVRKTHELLALIERIESEWDANTDPTALLDALRSAHSPIPNDHANLLVLTVSQKANSITNSALRKCLSLVKNLAKHRRTDIKQVIALLNQITAVTKMHAGAKIATEYQDHIDAYMEIIHIIAMRDDVTADDLKKLISYHDQRGQTRGKEHDGSIVHDLITIDVKRYNQDKNSDYNDYHLLEKYLALLIKLADAGKIDNDTIFNALRAPFGTNKKIGELIAESYMRPICMLRFAELCDRLASTQREILLPKQYSIFANYSLKDDICEHIEKLPTPEEKIAMCNRARDEDSALGKIMLLQRSRYPVDENRGAYGRIKEIFAQALIDREEAIKQETKIRSKAPRGSAPPLTEDEYVALFSEKPSAEYLLLTNEIQQLTKPEEIGSVLRMAAGYKENDKIKALFAHKQVNVDFQLHLGDLCQDATALYLAAEVGNLEGAKLLLEHNANPNLARENSMTPLCSAAVFGNTDMVNLLLNHGAKADMVTRRKNSPLYLAAKAGHAEVVDALVTHLCVKFADNVNDLVSFLQKDSQMLHLLEDTANGECILAIMRLTEFLAEKGVSKDVIHAMYPHEYSFKHINLKESIREAIVSTNGAKRLELCNKAIDDEDSLLHKIIWMTRDTILAKECRHGAGVVGEIEKIRDSYTEGNKKFAAEYDKYIKVDTQANDLTEFEQALKDGADTNTNVKYDRTILLYAAARNDIKLIELLLKYGANPASLCRMTIQAIRETIRIMHINNTSRLDAFMQQNPSLTADSVVVVMPEKIAEFMMFDDLAALLRQRREEQEARLGIQAQLPIAEVKKAEENKTEENIAEENIAEDNKAVTNKTDAEPASHVANVEGVLAFVPPFVPPFLPAQNVPVFVAPALVVKTLMPVAEEVPASVAEEVHATAVEAAPEATETAKIYPSLSMFSVQPENETKTIKTDTESDSNAANVESALAFVPPAQPAPVFVAPAPVVEKLVQVAVEVPATVAEEVPASVAEEVHATAVEAAPEATETAKIYPSLSLFSVQPEVEAGITGEDIFAVLITDKQHGQLDSIDTFLHAPVGLPNYIIDPFMSDSTNQSTTSLPSDIAKLYDKESPEQLPPASEQSEVSLMSFDEVSATTAVDAAPQEVKISKPGKPAANRYAIPKGQETVDLSILDGVEFDDVDDESIEGILGIKKSKSEPKLQRSHATTFFAPAPEKDTKKPTASRKTNAARGRRVAQPE